MSVRQSTPASSTAWAVSLAVLLVAALLLTTPGVSAQTPGQRIGDAVDPVLAAIDISQATHADGSVSRVVLGRRDAFPDNLSGAGAVGPDGSLLLVDPAPAGLSQEILTEVGRLLGTEPPATCGVGLAAEVVLLGGEAALSTQLADDLRAEDFCVDRLSGPSRVETSVEVARALLAAGTPRQTLLIARDDNPADSAAAGGWAAANRVPIVVTSSTSLHPAVAALLDPSAGQWADIVILGGPAAISADVEAAIVQAAGPGVGVRRIAGASRDDTARRIATDLWSTAAGTTAGIVNGFSELFWTYALPGGAALGSSSAPLLYVSSTQVPATTSEYLAGRTGVVTLGPATEIPDAIKAQAEAAATGTGGPVTPPPGDPLAGLRRIDVAAPAGNPADITVEVRPGETSLTMTFTEQGGGATITRVQGPGGLDLDPRRYADTAYDNSPEITITLPNEFVSSITAGTYTFSVAANNALTSVVGFAKVTDNNAPQAVDSVIYVVTGDPATDTPPEREQLAQLLTARFNEVFSPHNLFAGTVRWETVPADVVQRYSTLADDQLNDLCTDLTGRAGISRALVFGLITNYAPEGSLGVAPGAPGAPIVPSPTGCTTVAMAPHNEAGVFNASNFAQTLWHEAGHILGLEHTTELNGMRHDPIADTPECDASRDTSGEGTVDPEECINGGGGENLMFWAGTGRQISTQQAFVLRHSPVFRPRG